MKFYKILFSFYILLFINFIGVNNIYADDDYNTEYENYEDDYSETTNTNVDPWESMNRTIFDFNLYVMEVMVMPVSTTYKQIVPTFLRIVFKNILLTLKEPLIFLNSLAQLNFLNAAKSIATLTANLTVGLFGTINVAKNFPFYRQDLDFGQTLAFYGAPDGPFVMLPFFGPYYLRDGIGFGVDNLIHPVYTNMLEIGSHDYWIKELSDKHNTFYYIFLGSLKLLDSSENIDIIYNSMLKKSMDPYSLMKNAYLQKRNYEIQEINKRGIKSLWQKQ